MTVKLEASLPVSRALGGPMHDHDRPGPDIRVRVSHASHSDARRADSEPFRLQVSGPGPGRRLALQWTLTIIRRIPGPPVPGVHGVTVTLTVCQCHGDGDLPNLKATGTAPTPAAAPQAEPHWSLPNRPPRGGRSFRSGRTDRPRGPTTPGQPTGRCNPGRAESLQSHGPFKLGRRKEHK